MPPRPIPWVQAVAIIGLLALAAFDVTQPDGEVSVIVYAIVAGVAIGVDPGSFWNIVRGGK